MKELSPDGQAGDEDGKQEGEPEDEKKAIRRKDHSVKEEKRGGERQKTWAGETPE